MKSLSLEAIFLILKFGEMVNILKPNELKTKNKVF